MTPEHNDIDLWIASLEQLRDELRLKKHLLAMEAAQRLGELEARLERAEHRYRQDPSHPGSIAETLHDLHQAFAAFRERLVEPTR